MTVRLAALPAIGGAPRAAGSDKADAASSSVFHSWQAGHCPCHCGVRAPHAPHTYVGLVFAMGPLPARSNARGPAMLARGPAPARGAQNMCRWMPRFASTLPAISSIEVWVVLSTGMFSWRNMASAASTSVRQVSRVA